MGKRPSNPYAFGSSTSRFDPSAKPKFQPPPLTKSGSDGVQNAVSGTQGASRVSLNRTLSDNRGQIPPRSPGPPPSPKGGGPKAAGANAAQVQAAWLKFKDDIESAMEKKPKCGFYKNLSDMMHSKMEMLDQVGLASYPFHLILLRVLH